MTRSSSTPILCTASAVRSLCVVWRTSSAYVSPPRRIKERANLADDALARDARRRPALGHALAQVVDVLAHVSGDRAVALEEIARVLLRVERVVVEERRERDLRPLHLVDGELVRLMAQRREPDVRGEIQH